MNTYLFAWNPDKWDWISLEQKWGQLNLEQSILQLTETGHLTEKWNVQKYKSIQIGDRAFIIRLGKQPKGIFASGFVSSNPFFSKHYADDGKMVYRVTIDFDVLLHPEKESILTLDILNAGKLSRQHWTPQRSGITIKSELVDELEAVWFGFLRTEKHSFNHSISSTNSFIEGTPSEVMLTRYERNPYARKVCVEYYGCNCIICKLNFEEKYGAVGKDFIHVHHLTPISERGEAYTVDPIKDMRPVCANCHAIIHRKKQALSIDEVINLIKY
ncbi:MAG TPA: HNH endonuclease [Mucilaginibacter sp.]|jgi:5-methylcytosine-specific restriction protein A